ncbi:FG-GAP repeat domain-containing protein [Candidatus Eisenbacteria bacterium]|uniref:FG-GAP repeat domain-containing protein n=1 Tax=Eiseniibacteriota bacterium TaxID=2212470 RepID=A0ABV6YKF0_UNCEI
MDRVPCALFRFSFMIAGIICLSGMESSATAAWFDDPVETPTGQRLLRLGVADINRDGADDVVASSVSGTHIVLLGDLSGAMTEAQTLPGHLWGRFVLFEENHDGWPDLLCQSSGTHLQLWRNDGTGTFLDSGRTIPATYLSRSGDFDDDGRADILVGTAHDSVGIYYGTPDGLSEEIRPVSLAFVGEPAGYFRYYAAAIVDLDGDEKGDLLATGGISSEWLPEIRWRLGQGDGSFGELRNFAPFSPLSDFAAFDTADLDADGDLEIVVMWVGFEWGDTRFYSYEPQTEDLQYLGLAPGMGVPHFARMDGDQLWDLYMTSSGMTTVYQGLGGTDFTTVQSMPSYTTVRGSLMPPHGEELICVSSDSPHWIHVHPNLVIPAGIGDGQDRGRDRVQLVVWPSVTSDRIRLSLTGLGFATPFVHVHDVAGQLVRTIPLRDGEATWELRSKYGENIHSGVYWFSVPDPDRQTIRPKVLVVR